MIGLARRFTVAVGTDIGLAVLGARGFTFFDHTLGRRIFRPVARGFCAAHIGAARLRRALIGRVRQDRATGQHKRQGQEDEGFYGLNLPPKFLTGKPEN